MSVHASFAMLDSGPGSMPCARRDSVRQLCSRRTRSSTNDWASASATSTSSRTPALRRERVELVEEHLVHDLLLEREAGAPLVGQRRVRHRPALVQPADEVVLGDEHARRRTPR